MMVDGGKTSSCPVNSSSSVLCVYSSFASVLRLSIFSHYLFILLSVLLMSSHFLFSLLATVTHTHTHTHTQQHTQPGEKNTPPHTHTHTHTATHSTRREEHARAIISQSNHHDHTHNQ